MFKARVFTALQPAAGLAPLLPAAAAAALVKTPADLGEEGRGRLGGVHLLPRRSHKSFPSSSGLSARPLSGVKNMLKRTTGNNEPQ